MAREWYVSVNGDQKGPLCTSELRRWIKEGKLKRDSFVREGGSGPWRPLRQVDLPLDWHALVNMLIAAAVLAVGLEILWLLTHPALVNLAVVLLAMYAGLVVHFWPKLGGRKPG
jgi:hypothetical protein